MNKETLLTLVEALREAGRRKPVEIPPYLSGEDYYAAKAEKLEVDRHNAAVDAAAKALVAEIKDDVKRCTECGQPYRNEACVCNNPACNRDCVHGF